MSLKQIIACKLHSKPMIEFTSKRQKRGTFLIIEISPSSETIGSFWVQKRTTVKKQCKQEDSSHRFTLFLVFLFLAICSLCHDLIVSLLQLEMMSYFYPNSSRRQMETFPSSRRNRKLR